MAEAETTERKETKGGGIQLFVEHAEQLGDPVAPVRWCVGHGIREALHRYGAQGVWILFSIVHETAGEVARKIVPLADMMTYLQFHRPGRHTIHATILWATADNWDTRYMLKRTFLRRYRNGCYANELIDKIEGMRTFRLDWVNGVGDLVSRNKGEFSCNAKSCRQLGSGACDVVVPAEGFAKEPPAWLKRWVYLTWNAPPDADECEFRKRLPYAIFVQIFVLAAMYGALAVAAIVWITFKLLWALIGTLMGVRPYAPAENDANFGVNWRMVFGRPFVSIDDVWDGDFIPHRHHGGGSFLLYDRNGEPRERDWLWKFFTPMIWVGAFAALLVAGLFMKKSMAASMFFGAKWTLVGFASFVGFLFLFAGVSWFTRFVERLLPDWQSRKEERKARREKERSAREATREEERRRAAEAQRLAMEARLETLVCTGEPLAPRLEALPPERQTFTLRFQRLKAKVCRPYAVRS